MTNPTQGRPAMTRSEQVTDEVLEGISEGLVGLHREFYGKGPTVARTYLNNDTVMCLLEGGFTTVERTLIDDGKPTDVEMIRRSFQGTMKRHFTGVIEQATGRQVIAYMSQVHTDPDLAVEIFVLEPTEDGAVNGQFHASGPQAEGGS